MIGQNAPREVLKAIVKSQRYGSAYLFAGPPGVGKTTAGRIFAMAVLCDSSVDGNPCCVCESCVSFLKEQHYSYRELDSASYGGKDDMVKLRDEGNFVSVGKKKILLLDESHGITRLGQDSLLKQVEQCPDHLIYIFCTTEPDQMKKTLRERCMEFHISRIDSDLITQRLKYICEQEKFNFQIDALQILADKSEGHVRAAINLLEEVVFLGDITVENIEKVSRSYDEDIFTIISNLGTDLVKVIKTYQKIAAYISSNEFYSSLVSFIGDASKILYGFDDFPEKRKNYLLKLKEIHGYSLMEFLSYLITRDKFVDKVGLQSDLVVLHYKFSANSFVPRIVQKETQVIPQSQNVPIKKEEETSKSAPSLSFNELQKLSTSERSAILRQQRRTQKVEQKEEESFVSTSWPLPKEERPGKSSDDEILTPQEFSQSLVGGRGGSIRSMVDPGTQ